MIELPLRAFCLMSNDGEDKIEMTITEVFGFPETTSYAGGYDFKGALVIHAGSYEVHSQNFYSTTGELYNLNISLEKCYNSLTGTARYNVMYEKNLEFEVSMIKLGHAIIDGTFREYPHLANELIFQIGTDQTCIRSAIDDLKQIEKLFGDNKGKQIV